MKYPIITLNSVGIFHYDKWLFKNINIQIYSGQKCLLVGKNGSGKTTLLKLLYGEIEPDIGSKWSKPNIKISYLHQKPKIFKNQTLSSYTSEHLIKKLRSPKL